MGVARKTANVYGIHLRRGQATYDNEGTVEVLPHSVPRVESLSIGSRARTNSVVRERTRAAQEAGPETGRRATEPGATK